jgi:hypothetical protein
MHLLRFTSVVVRAHRPQVNDCLMPLSVATPNDADRPHTLNNGLPFSKRDGHQRPKIGERRFTYQRWWETPDREKTTPTVAHKPKLLQTALRCTQRSQTWEDSQWSQTGFSKSLVSTDGL